MYTKLTYNSDEGEFCDTTRLRDILLSDTENYSVKQERRATMSNQTKTFLQSASLSTLFLLALCYLILFTLNLPVVEVSRDGNCVRVHSPNPDHNCHRLPERYITQKQAY